MRLITLIALLFLPKVWGETTLTSMRRCMLLPVKDSVKGSVGFKVFNEVEEYLKNSDWCFYHSNSELMNILGNYRSSIHAALENEEVLRIIAEKTSAGTLIKIEMNFLVKGTEVDVSVIGANGSDIYFKQSTRLETTDPVVVGQTIKNWLELYKKNIPYTARVIGVLGNQFTIDGGDSLGLRPGAEIEIVRPLQKKTHPLLKEIVDWQTTSLAKGRILQADRTQSHGKAESYISEMRLRPGDWVLLKNLPAVTDEYDKKFGLDPEGEEFGKLGNFSVSFGIGSGSDGYSNTTGTNNEIGGLTYGLDLDGELWITRSYWVGAGLEKRFGTYSKKEGTLSSESNSLNFSSMRLAVGYKYLPLGYFFGPQLDGYLGYASYTYGLDPRPADNFGEVNFSGLYIGVRGSLPVLRDYRFFIGGEFMVTTSFQEDTPMLGDADSQTNYRLEFGGSYQYGPNMQLFSKFSYVGSKAKFKSPEQTLSLKESSLHFGARFFY